jgi:superoxide dismutase
MLPKNPTLNPARRKRKSPSKLRSSSMAEVGNVRQPHIRNDVARLPGHINHSLFWKNLAPAAREGGKLESGPLKTAIERDFGSVEDFKKSFNTKTAGIQGSGWGWLVRRFGRTPDAV